MSVVAIPVVAIVGTIYNSPFAIFLPPLEDGDTVTTVASAYVADFNREVNELKSNHKKDVVAERNQEIIKEIKSIFDLHKHRYGVRRVHQELINRGYQINHKRVQRLMHEAGLAGKRPKEKYHSYKGEVGKIADNIINRDFSTTAPLQKWTTDVSQFNLSWGKCYISPVLDMNTNEIISYELSTSPNLEQIERMLNKAFEKFPSVEGLIFHSDQGWQYQHAYYRNALQEHGIIQSMSRKGNCYDNCINDEFPFPAMLEMGIFCLKLKLTRYYLDIIIFYTALIILYYMRDEIGFNNN